MNRLIYLVAILAIATSCTSNAKKEIKTVVDPHAGHAHAIAAAAQAVKSEEGHADEIIFPVAQALKTDFAVEKTEPSTFNQVTKCSGQIVAAQGDQVNVSAPVSGVITFADARLSEGAAVNKGQRLFYISSKNVASGDLTAKSEAAYIKAKADFERAEKLVADKIVSQKEYENLKLAFEQARTEYEPLRSAKTGQGTGVVSQISGYVTSLAVSPGQYVEVGAPLATVSQNRRLQLRADVSQKYYDRLGSVQSATFIAPSSDRTFDLRAMGGRLVSVGKSSQSSAGMIPITFEFDNRGGVVAGSFVEVFLVGAPIANVISLPLTAITEQQGLYYVYVQLDEEGYQKREVKLGASDGVNVQILSGLSSGENVVTRGAVNVKMAAASGSIPHGHSH